MSDLIVPLPTKRCTKCGNEYPATAEFFQHRNKKTGTLRAECRACGAAHRHKHYLEHRDEICANVRAYQSEHKDEKREYGRQYRERRGDDLKRAKREYYVANAETVKAKAAAYRANRTPEQLAAARERDRLYGKVYRAENRDEINQRNRERYAHPDVKAVVREKHRAYRAQPHAKAAANARVRKYHKTERGQTSNRRQGHVRRALLASATGSYTIDEVVAIRAAQTDKQGRLRCWWCGNPIKGTPHLDHKIALAAGGSNDAGNLCYACASCNLSKQTKSPGEFAGRLL